MMDTKAQAAMEYLMIMGISMLLLVPLFSVVSSYTYSSKTRLRVSAMEDSLQSLADSADMVYSQGYPARITTKFYVPEGTISTNVTDHYFTARVRKSAGPTDLFRRTNARLEGSLPDSPGAHNVKIEMTESGFVNVSY